MIKRIFHLIILCLIAKVGIAQSSGDFSFCTGNNYTSFGQYIKLSGRLSYQHAGWVFSTAAGVVFSEARENKLDAYRLSVAKDFEIKDKPFRGNVFYQRTPFSHRLNEHNAGMLFNRQGKRWYFDLGVNTRIYQLTHNYAEDHSYETKAIWEPVNVMYKITYHTPISTKIGLNASVTNFDNFIIEQETNPFLIVDFRYQVSKKSKVYFDLAYQQAGFFNIRVNYFGYFLKAGYLFDINFSHNKVFDSNSQASEINTLTN